MRAQAMGAWLLLPLVLFAWGSRTGAAGPTGLTRAEREFLEHHWRRPVPPQGPAPARFSPIEKSLAPASCGVCHPTQFADWQTTIHSRSMGPGVAGQLADMVAGDPASVLDCLTCHAPFAEQSPVLRGPTDVVRNPDFDPGLERQGLVCAACHVRRWERFGPPRPDGTLESASPRASLPHNGATRTAAFVRSEFCMSCHQFGADGYALNGKLLENTYEEWKASPAGQEGLQCQGCHMPDRRHLWRGIHDPEMVKAGLEIALATNRAHYAPGAELRLTLTITSIRVGHYFPTYVTPWIVVRAALLDAQGRTIAGSVEEGAIGRDVTLDLSREVADTRIPPGGRFDFEYRRRLDRAGLRVAIAVTVFPDHFYTGLFESLLAGGAGAGAAQIREALDATRRSAYTIFARTVPLT